MCRVLRLLMLALLVGAAGLSGAVPLPLAGTVGVGGPPPVQAGEASGPWVGSGGHPLLDLHSCMPGAGAGEKSLASAAWARGSSADTCLPCRILRGLVSLLYQDLLKPLLELFLGFSS